MFKLLVVLLLAGILIGVFFMGINNADDVL